MLIGSPLETIFRLFLAFVAGAVLGYERSSKRVDAGFRTHILVCMSSCAIMITNIHTFLFYQAGDLTRMPAQVISGVGFLGAGCILVTGQHRIKGVTTAAGIWAAACLGLCIGAGDYLVAGIEMVIALVTMTALRLVDRKIDLYSKYMRFYVELESASAVSNLMKYMRANGMKINDMEFLDKKQSGSVGVVVVFRLSQRDSTEHVISAFEQQKGVIYASEF